jgi:hypothetical protein
MKLSISHPLEKEYAVASWDEQHYINIAYCRGTPTTKILLDLSLVAENQYAVFIFAPLKDPLDKYNLLLSYTQQLSLQWYFL